MGKKRYAIGIDLGGTNVRFGAVGPSGRLLKEMSRGVGADRTPEGIIRLLRDGVGEMRLSMGASASGRDSSDGMVGVGIGAPGVIDHDKGVVVRSPHYPDWKNFLLKKELSRAVRLPVVLDNDANFIAAGEMWKGAGRKFRNFIMVTIGTGIGGGIIVVRRIFHGDFGSAGEIGHQLIDINGERCDCGGKGCWENYVSIEGLKWFIRTSGDPKKGRFLQNFGGNIEKVTPKALYEMAMDGDIFASAIWKKFGAYLGAGIVSLVNITGIFNYVIGGGIGNAFELFISEAKSEIGRRLYKETAGLVTIKKAELGDSAGILGSVSGLWLREPFKS